MQQGSFNPADIEIPGANTSTGEPAHFQLKAAGQYIPQVIISDMICFSGAYILPSKMVTLVRFCFKLTTQ